MDYSNQEIPEGINVSPQHPLKDFFILTAGVCGVLFIAVTLLALLAEKLVVYIPFTMEEKLVAEYSPPVDPAAETRYLQNLADRLATHIDTPEDMTFHVHYVDAPVENAYATLGGHIYIYRGLIDMLPHENALAMVVAHEMGHILHRHPVIAMGRGVVIGLFLATLTGMSGDRIVGQVINSAGLITLLNFTRSQEREADRTALAAVAAEYGHVNGADVLFRVLLDSRQDSGPEPPRFLNTHPLSRDRIADIESLAKENDWPLQGATWPLPAYLQSKEED